MEGDRAEVSFVRFRPDIVERRIDAADRVVFVVFRGRNRSGEKVVVVVVVEKEQIETQQKTKEAIECRSA